MFSYLQEWEIIVKTLPDGSKKRFRRRIITTTITTVTTTTYILRPDGTEEHVVMESKPIESTTETFEDGPVGFNDEGAERSVEKSSCN